MIQSKSSISLRTRIRKAVKSVDSYALPITLSYNGKDKFTTLPGGVLTILSRFVILLFFLVQIPEVVNKNKTVIKKTVRINLDNDVDPYELNLENFDFAIRVFNPFGILSDEMLTNISKYFKFEFSTSSLYPQQIGNQTIMATNNIVHDFIPCTNDRLGNLTEQTAGLQLSQNGWVCPDTINEKLIGSPFGMKRTTLRIRVVPCNQADAAGIVPDNVTCASDAEIEKAIQDHFIQIAVLNQYFDENEFATSPIKKEITVIMQNIAPNTAFFKANLYQKVTITTKDSWFGSTLNNLEYSYLESVDLLNGVQGYPKPGFHDMITIIFSKYDRQEVIVRRVTSLMDILATSGGFSSVIMFAGIIISKLFQQALYHQSLMNKLYKTQTTAYDIQDFNKQQVNEDTLFKIAHDLDVRQNLNVSFYQYLKHKISKVFHCMHRSKREKGPCNSYFQVFNRRLHQEIDVISVIKTISKINLLQDMILTHKQRKLLPLVDFNLINQHDLQLQSFTKSEIKIDRDRQLQLFRDLLDNQGNRKDRVFLSYLINFKKSKNQVPNASPPTLKPLQILDGDDQTKSNLMLNEIAKVETYRSMKTKGTIRTPKSSITPHHRKKLDSLKDINFVKFNESQRNLMKYPKNAFNE